MIWLEFRRDRSPNAWSWTSRVPRHLGETDLKSNMTMKHLEVSTALVWPGYADAAAVKLGLFGRPRSRLSTSSKGREG